MALSTEERHNIALSQSTAEEQTYISGTAKKNRTWLIVVVTIVILAVTAYYFYKH
jgi:hypothetical protein